MALSLVGTPLEDTSTGAVNIILTLPGAIAEGDVVYVAFAAANNTNTDWTLAMNTSGYFKVFELYGNSPTRDMNLALFRKRMGPTPDSAAVTVPMGGSSFANGAVAMVWRGVDATTPEDATPTTVERAGNGTAVDSPSITTVTDGAVVLTLGAGSGGSVFNPTAPANYENEVAINLNGALQAYVSIAMASRLISTAGAENPGAWGSFAVPTNDGVCEATVAIRPAPVIPIYALSAYQFLNDDSGGGLGEPA